MNSDLFLFEKNAISNGEKKPSLIHEINDAIDTCRQQLTVEDLQTFNEIAREIQQSIHDSKSPTIEINDLKERIRKLSSIVDPEDGEENNPFRKILLNNKLAAAEKSLKYYNDIDPFDKFYNALPYDDKINPEVQDFIKLAHKIRYSLLDTEECLQTKREIRLGLIARMGVLFTNINAYFLLEAKNPDIKVTTSLNLFIEQYKKQYTNNTGFPFSRTYQRVINELKDDKSQAATQLLSDLDELFYTTNLNETQKLQKMRIRFFESIQTYEKSVIPSLLQILDPFYVAYSELPEQFKRLDEVQHLYQKINTKTNETSLKKRIEKNIGLLTRLRHIIVHFIQIPYQVGINNNWDEYHRTKNIRKNIDSQISELKVNARRDYPFSFFYQHLRFELNEMIKQSPDKRISVVYEELDKIHLSDESEKNKLLKFEQAHLDFYYHVRKHQGAFDNKLGDLLLDFLKSPIKMNLEEKYDIKIPQHVYDPKAKAPDISMSMEKPVRVVRIDIKSLFTNFDENNTTLAINLPLLKQLKKEYDQMELVIENKPEQKERIKTALDMLKNERVVNYTPRQIRHLYPGRNINVVEFNNKKSFVSALEKYRTSRLLEEFENDSKYNSLFGWSWFFVQSSDVKRSAAKKLIDYKTAVVNCSSFDHLQPFTDDEQRALKTDSLGELLRFYDCGEIEINEIQRQLIEFQKPKDSENSYIPRENSQNI